MRAILPIFLMVILSLPVRAQSESADMEQVFGSAVKLLEEGSYKEALLDYNRLINSGFENDAIWVKRGLAHYYLKEYDKAQADFDEAFKRQIRTAELLGFRSLTKIHLGNEQEAITGLEQAFAAGFRNPQAAFITGNTYFTRNDYQSAIRFYNLAGEWGSKNPVLFNNRGKAHMLLSKFDQAQADYSKAIELDAEYEKAYSNRAALYFSQENWEKAGADLKWLNEAPGYQLEADEFAMLGLISLQNEEYTKALDQLENALKRQSEWKGLYKALGTAYAGTDNADKAIQMLEVSLEKEGADKEVISSLANLHYQEKNYATSRKYSSDYLSDYPADIRMQEIGGLASYHEGNAEQALTVLSGISNGSTNDEVHGILAQIYFDQGSFDNALKSAERSSEKSTDGGLLRIRSFSHYELNQYEQALNVMSEWKNTETASIDCWILSARSNMILGKYTEAESDISKAMSLDDSSYEVNALYGEVLLMNKDYENAFTYLNRAVEKKQEAKVQAFLGLAAFRLDKFEEAYSNLNAAAGADKLSAEGLRDLTVSAFETSRFEETLTFAAKAVENGLLEERILLYRGLAATETGDYDRAGSDLKAVNAAGTSDHRVFTSLGIMSEESEEAVSWYTKAIEHGSEDRVNLVNRGEAYMQLGRFEAAVADFSVILEEDKDHDKARYARGRAFFALEKYQEASEDLLLVNTKSLNLPVNEMIALSYARTEAKRAEEYVDKSIALRTEIAEIHFHSGKYAAAASDWEKADNRLTGAENLGFTSSDLYDLRGEVRFELKKYQESLSDLERSGNNQYLIGMANYYLENYPETISALGKVEGLKNEGQLALGDALYREKQWQPALEIFNQLINDGSTDAVIFRHRGMVHLEMTEFEKAKTDLARSLELEPGNAETQGVLGQVYFRLSEFDKVTGLYESGAGAALLKEAAISYYELKDYTKAQPVLEEVSRSGKADARSEGALGHIYFIQENYENAVKSLSLALELDDSNTDWKNWKGLSLVKLERYSQAEPVLEEAIEEGISSPETYFAAGNAAYENGNNEKTIKWLENALKAGSQQPEAGFILGNAYFKSDQFEKAVTAYDHSEKNGLEDPVLYNNRGKAYFNLDRLPDAIKSYDQALALDPEYIRTLENRGEAYYITEEYESAAEDLRNVINLDEEEDGSVRLMLADTYMQLEEYRKAVVFYGEAIRKGKESAEVYFKRGSAYAAIEDWSGALGDLNQSFSMGKKDAELFLERANVHIRMENTRAAMTDLNEAIAHDEGNADAYFNRGYLHELNENFNEAISDYRKAIDLNPEDGIAFYSLANSLVSQGNVGAALNPIDKAIALEPENGNYYKVKGNILYRVERNDQACENWRKAVDFGDIKAGYYVNEYCD